ncbi:patatin-like phospholipase family protein [Lutimonas halocynthiae]|uniref:patatin-like phospholipase family protein n=1 Tax=Lutimonas halocynthiae TaxID=1446477 RepID=UPI0025B33CE6|nr:patatin-like phospholipase family protein [Lutimonas halocynthiae]MDN3642080.1 patatin-like phospholipase family protein [Lutimonas halocynthiae]
MKKLAFIILVLAFSIFSQELIAQEEKPKVALVLSGGGAKGIAHIPLLQALDSLGIVPDIIMGTSMGSIVGGFYAAGYSGDSIAVMANNANWTELLGGDVNLVDVSMEEKSEFKRHLVDFDIIEGKPKVSAGFLRDQKLREFISSYTYPVFNIDDFDKLPIPFRAMTTDIVNGKEVFLDRGSLGFAMRASMSIPGVFQAVPYENTLLVDGGVLNNFPVDRAREMGYDIVIGSDVGGGMQTKDKLSSIPALLFQTGMLTSNLKNPANRDACDILIDHMPYLTYSTGDFDKAEEIFEEGKIATDVNLQALADLAFVLKKFKQREHSIPKVENEFLIDKVIYSGVSEANMDLVKGRAKIKEGERYSTQELIDGVDRAMGTNLFSQITYDGGLNNGMLELRLKGHERSQSVIKGSLHYDSYRGVGLMVNYTGRNIIGKSSRFLVTADIAEQPRFRVQYQKQFGPEKTWWWRSEVLGEFLDQKFYLSGEVADDMNSDFFQFDNQFNKNLNSLHSYVGLDLSYEFTKLKPKIDPSINNNILNLRHYEFKNFEVGIHYLYNVMDKVFYATSGTIVGAKVSRSIHNEVDIEYAEGDERFVKGSTNDFTKFNFDIEHRKAFSKKVSGIVGGNLAFIVEDPMSSGDLSFSTYGYSARYALGGTVVSPRKGTYLYPGMHEDEIFVSQMMKINLGVQINPFSKFYFTPHLNLASVGFGDFDDYIEDAFSPEGNWSEAFETSSIVSAGVNFAFHSFLGPVNFDVSYINDVNKVRVFFSVGLLFNRSN